MFEEELERLAWLGQGKLNSERWGLLGDRSTLAPLQSPLQSRAYLQSFENNERPTVLRSPHRYCLLRRVVRLDEAHVGGGADDSADKRAYNRDPEVAVTQRPHLPAPAGEEGEEARAEVAGRVERVARVKAEGHADAREHQSNGAGEAVRACRLVELVADSEDAADKQSRTDDLVRQSGPVGDLSVRVCGEDPLRGHALRVVDVEPRVVHNEYDDGGRECAGGLGNEVTRHLVPLETLEHGQREGDGRVEVATADTAGEVDAEEQRNAPAQVHRQVVAGTASTQHVLRDGAVADEHEDEGADEFC
ncbi:hypothetical protein ON010_g14040 [Phytophthora cinnamomi]|nr:hypothetical protein ON010_g14040 [Phytophthora cinnamomi]